MKGDGMKALKFEETPRGFVVARFVDRYGVECSLQASSLATEAAVWLGPSSPNPKILATKALAMGREDLTEGETTGWVPWPLPEGVSCDTRMHLTRDMALIVGMALVKFADTGKLPPAKKAAK